MTRSLLLFGGAGLLALGMVIASFQLADERLTIGSKYFTESVILGEMARLAAAECEIPVRHQAQLGGTPVLWKSLLRGEIDIYPEYTGTLQAEIFRDASLTKLEDFRARLAAEGVAMTAPLGFNNSYALGMERSRAAELGIAKISDLRQHPNLRLGFSNEFLQRSEGWPTLRQTYGLPQRNVKGLSHELAYAALGVGSLDVVDVYTTDYIRNLDMLLLEDDRAHFPRYDAVFLYREELAESSPELIALLHRFEGAINDDAMRGLNREVLEGSASEQRAAAGFVQENLEITAEVVEPGFWQRLWHNTWRHLLLVVLSLGAAICAAVPLGVLAAKLPRLGHGILAVAEIIQTIPGLALLVLLMPLVAALHFNAVGPAPAVAALFLYSLLPIIRNTYTGVRDIPAGLLESAQVLGLSPAARLRLVELPLASRMILAGIKTTAAINVGYATLGGLIGAGGYGEPIMSGLRLMDTRLMLEGAVPAALLALLVKFGFEGIERLLVPPGLRLKPARD